MAITHAYVSTKNDPADGTVVGASKWNASHVEDYPVSFNVRDYGAVGNNSTDDTTAINDAIDAATASVGGIVFFPPGIYITQPLTLPPGTVLQGVSGQGYYNATTTVPNAETKSTIKLKAASAASLIKPDDTGGNDATHVRIRDLCFDANAIAQKTLDLPDEGSGLSRFWLIERCYFVNSGQTNDYAIYIGNNNTAVTMRDCVAFNGTSGSAAGDNGVGWYGQDGFMDNCFIGYFSGDGLSVLGGAADQTFMMIGGGVFTCTTGVVVAGKGPTFIGVSIDHNYNDGVYVGYGPSQFIGCTFHSNSRTTDNTWSDIYINAANVHCSVIGCRHGNLAGDVVNNAKYFINVGQTGVVLKAQGNTDEGGDLGTGFINYSFQVTAPAFPATTVAVTNTTGTDVTAYIANGTSAITVVTLGGVASGLQIAANGWGTVSIAAGQTFACTYAGGTPTWTWFAG